MILFGTKFTPFSRQCSLLVQDLDFHAHISSVPFEGSPNANPIIGPFIQEKTESQRKVFVFLFGEQIPMNSLFTNNRPVTHLVFLTRLSDEFPVIQRLA